MAKEIKHVPEKKRRRTQMWASVLIMVGVLLIAQNTGVVPNAFGKLWPLVLVVIGAFLLLPQG